MTPIGILGGMSWESTSLYYQYINRSVQQHCGGIHSAPLFITSFDFVEISQLQAKGDWSALTDIMVISALQLESQGAGAIVIATNTMHKMAEDIQSSLSIPILHIADALGEYIQQHHADMTTLGLLGTAFTMEQDFYKARLQDNFGLSCITPDLENRQQVHTIIYDELCKGQFLPDSKQRYINVINQLHNDGAQGIIMGCTEIPLLLDIPEPSHAAVTLPLFDTTAIHAEYAAQFILENAS